MIPVVSMAIGSPLTVAGAAAALSVATDAPHSLDKPLRALPTAKSHWPAFRSSVLPEIGRGPGYFVAEFRAEEMQSVSEASKPHDRCCIGRELSHPLNKDFHQARPWRPEKNP